MSRSNVLRDVIAPLLCAAAALLVGCGPAPSADPPTAAETAKNNAEASLRLAIDQWPGYFPAVLADELGYFADAGVQVTIELPGNTDRMLAEFAAGGYDLVGVALGDLITLSRNRSDVAVLLVSDESAGGDALLAAAGVDVGEGGPLRIGTNLGGFGELFVRELLPRLQIDPARVEWVNIDASDVPAALQKGALELGHCWEPYATQAEQLGARRLASSADTPGLIPDVIAGTRLLASARGDALRAFNSAWFRAVDWWQANPQQASDILTARLQLSADEVSLKGIRLLGLDDNRRLLGATGEAMLSPTIDRYSAFFVTQGRLLEPVQAAQMMLPDRLP